MASNKLEENLLKIIKIFNGHPHIFISFLLTHNALSNNFKHALSNSTIKQKPKKFHDMEKAIEYYSALLIDETNKPDNEDEWNAKLLKAVMSQKYEDAAEIRDLMKKKGIKIKI